jgi:hypothetical protein
VIPIWPPLMRSRPPERRRRTHRAWRRRFRLYHDDRRVLLHRHGYVGQERLIDANAEIGNASWVHPFWGVFGDPTILVRYMPLYMARIIKFPERRSEIAKIRAELKELQRTFRCVEGM